MSRHFPLSGGSAAAIFACPIGPRIYADQPDRSGSGVSTADLLTRFDQHHTEVKGLLAAAGDKLGGLQTKISTLDAQLTEVEQKMARRPGPGGVEAKSWGQRFVESQAFRDLASSASQRGVARIEIETKTILSSSGTWGAGVSPTNSLVVADRQPIVQLPMRPLVIRDLISVAQTVSNAVEYPVQASFTNNAAVVAENTLKPTSDVTFDLRSAPVRTVAHRMLASRQILDDAPGLQGFIDTEMRYGLGLAEEAEILFGDGTGQHLLGIIPQATAYAAPFAVTGETAIDRLALALTQVELALYQASGIVLNPADLRKILLIKDGMGRYIAGDPLGQNSLTLLWNVPVASSLTIPAGTFLVGAFKRAATLHERMAVEVLISTEDGDNFSKNMVTVRAEERVALAVTRPAAFVTGTLP